MPAGGDFFDQTYFPYVDDYPSSYDGLDLEMSRVLWAAFAHSPWDHIHDEGFWETLRRRALKLRQTTDQALMVVVGCNLFEWGTFLRRVEPFDRCKLLWLRFSNLPGVLVTEWKDYENRGH